MTSHAFVLSTEEDFYSNFVYDPRSNIKTGTIRNPRQNSQLIRSTNHSVSKSANPLDFGRNPQSASFLRPNPSIRNPSYSPPSRNIPNRICKTASKFEKEILKIGRCIGHVLSNMRSVAFSSLCFFVTSCKQRQTNEQRTITPLTKPLYSLPLLLRFT